MKACSLLDKTFRLPDLTSTTNFRRTAFFNVKNMLNVINENMTLIVLCHQSTVLQRDNLGLTKIIINIKNISSPQYHCTALKRKCMIVMKCWPRPSVHYICRRSNVHLTNAVNPERVQTVTYLCLSVYARINREPSLSCTFILPDSHPHISGDQAWAQAPASSSL